jgi:hypothetical protein
MRDDDSPTFCKEIQHPRIELSNVTHFKDSVTERLGQRLPVILGISEFRETGEHRREIAGIARLQVIQKLTHWARSRFGLVKLYYKVHIITTSSLMCGEASSIAAGLYGK